jgi:hypothetical protein
MRDKKARHSVTAAGLFDLKLQISDLRTTS